MKDNISVFWLPINERGDKAIYSSRPIYNKVSDEWEKSPRRRNCEKFEFPKSFLSLELGKLVLYKIIFHEDNLINLGGYISLSKLDKEENCSYFYKSANDFEVYIVGKIKPKTKHLSYSMDIKRARTIFGLKFINALKYNTIYKLDSYEFIFYFHK